MLWNCHERTELLAFQRPPATQADGAPRFPDTISGNGRPRDALDAGRATDIRRTVHWTLRSVAEVGLSARTHKRGGTARTLAGSVRNYDVNYTANGDLAHVPRLTPRSVLPV